MPEPEKKEGTPEVKPEEKKETLIFGKYRTMEEAEKGHKELERGFHDKSAESARNKQALDDLLTEPREVREKNDEPETEETFAQRFMEQPKKFLEEFGKNITTTLSRQFQGYLDTRDAVKEFLDENKDLKENLRLFTVSLHGTNPKKSVSERLKEAAEGTRSEINRIKEQGIAAQKANDAEQRKVGATGGGEAGGEPQKKAEDPKGESYQEYMAGRATEHGKVLGIV